jgi:integrase
MNRIPSASVINNHNSALNRIFDEAVERGYMSKIMIPPLRNDGVKTEKRPTITIDEYSVLHRGLRRWVDDGRKGNESHLRQVLRDYILILAHTGIRAGTEAMNLRWRDVSFFTKNGIEYLGMTVNGKTGERHVTVRHAAIRYFDRLRKINPDWSDFTFHQFLAKKYDDYVFRVKGKDRKGKVKYKDMTTAFGRMFQRYLERRELLLDRSSGKPRTLYSLRHMYAVFALTYNRMSIYTLAEHMGTSVPMIERHYGQILLRDKAAEIAGDKEWFMEKARREEKAKLKQSKPEDPPANLVRLVKS